MSFIRIFPKVLTKIECMHVNNASWIISFLYEAFLVFLPNTQKIIYFLLMFALVRIGSHLCVHCLRKLVCYRSIHCKISSVYSMSNPLPALAFAENCKAHFSLSTLLEYTP